jgi:diguanylate cyclase (GGDEF)-like protein
MRKTWEFFENMNEIVYVSDIENYEVVYMNHKARKIHGFQSVEELKGKKCYEVLQNSASPCAICTNPNLRSGYFQEWKYFNPLVGKSYLIKDSMMEVEGRKYRIELAIDLSLQENQHGTAKDYINNEAIVNEALRMSLSTPDSEEAIAILVEYIGRALRCERIYIFEKEQKQPPVLHNTYEWCARGIIPKKESLQNIPAENASIWLKRLEDNETVVIQNVEEIRETDPVIYDYLIPKKIHSLVLGPLIFNNEMIGFFGVDNPPKEAIEGISTLFLIMGHFIVSLIRRRDLYQKLEYISLYDQLTGVGNRHAMDRYMEEIEKNNSIGVVSCDVMGLKKVNDTQGHQAGDDLLIRTCNCLREAFPDESLFRMGGDEFLVMSSGKSREELLEKAENLKKIMKKWQVVMAVGCAWYPDSKEPINKILAEADEIMYEDKREYYAKEKIRRILKERQEKEQQIEK